MSIRRQLEIWLGSIGLGFMAYIFAKLPYPIQPWMYGGAVAVFCWGAGYNIGHTRVRLEQILKELEALRESLVKFQASNSN